MELTRAYAFLDTVIAVAADQAAVLEWLDEFLQPAFARCDGAIAHAALVIHTDGQTYDALRATRPAGDLPRAPCFSLDQRVTTRHHWTVDDRVVLEDEKFEALYVVTDSQVEILARRGSLRFRTAVMRVIGELATARALADAGRIQLHAAALAVGGRGMLLAGPKTSGKTTLLARLAGSPGAAVIANDRSLLSRSPAGIEVHGVPMNVKIRPWTVARIPDAFSCRLPLPMHALLTRAEIAAASEPGAIEEPSGEIKLSMPQLARALRAPLAAHARLALIAFPQHAGDPAAVAVARLSPAEAEQRLREVPFGLHSGKSEPTVFERVARVTRPNAADERVIRELAVSMPCFTVTVGAEAYRRAQTAVDVIAALLGGG